MSKCLTVGKQGEQFAVDFLKQRGYRILQRNYTQPYGEIDIIAQKNDLLIFIEVKTRTSSQFGSPLEAVTAKKQYQISRVAQTYLLAHKLTDMPARFDVIAVVLAGKKMVDIQLIKNAFGSSYGI
jgi:putative endonuclease